MNKPQVINNDDLNRRIAVLESEMETIKTNYKGLVGTLNESFSKVASDMVETREAIVSIVSHTESKIQATRDDLQKGFRDELRDFRRDIKDDVKDSFNGFRWTVGIIIALAVAILKLIP